MNRVAAADASPMGRHQGREGGRPQQGGVAGQDHEVVKLAVVIAERRQRHRQGVPRPPLYGLFDHLERQARRLGFGQGLCHPRRAVADDDDHPGEVQARKGAQHPQDHRPPAQPVKRLGARAAHARPLACGQHHRRQLGCSPAYECPDDANLGRSSSRSSF